MASPGRPGLVVLLSVILAASWSAALGTRESTSSSSSALPSRDDDAVVAESPVTLRTTTDAAVTAAAAPSSTTPTEDVGGQQDRPGLADMIKAQLGDRPQPARTMILFADNATASLQAEHVFGERGAKAIRFTSKRGNELDPGITRTVFATTSTTTSTTPSPTTTALQTAEQPSPWSALGGIVSDCLLGFSATCLQRKLLVFVNRLSRLERVNLLGSYVSLVRVSDDAPPPIAEHVLEARVVDDEDDAETALESLMQHNVDDFFESHVLRFQLPSWFSSAINGVGVGTGRDINAVDVDLEDIVEPRQKGGSKGGGKGGSKASKKKKKKKKKQSRKGNKMMKKMMKGMSKMGGMMMFGMLGKVAMLAPLLGLLSTLSLKASAIALLIAKFMLLRSVFSGGLPSFGGGKGGLSSLFSGFGGGSQPSSNYGAPAQPSSSYGTPSQPSSGYGTPSQPSSGYGAPAATAPNSFRPPSTPQFTPPATSYGTPAGSSYSQPSSDYGVPTGGSYFPTAGSSSGASSSSSSSSSSLFGGGASSLFGGGGASSGASSGGSATSGGFGASGGQSGYVGGGSHWVNKRAWDAQALAYNGYLQEPEMHTTTEPML